MSQTFTGDDSSSNYMCFITNIKNSYLRIVFSRNSENILGIIIVITEKSETFPLIIQYIAPYTWKL